MGEALIYEFMLCKALNCQRGGADGKADADLYRKMEKAVRAVELQKEAIVSKKPLVFGKTIDDLEYDARVAIAHVRQGIGLALRELIKRNGSLAQNEKFVDLLKLLNPDQYDRKVLDHIVEETWEMIKEQ